MITYTTQTTHTMQTMMKKTVLAFTFLTISYIYTTACVCINTNPSPLIFMNGIMFDCDCNMEVFRIKGIENFPDNDLHVFDSNGIEVYHKEGYKNDWKGNCKEKEIKKGDVLYYLFDDGEGQTYSGIIKVN